MNVIRGQQIKFSATVRLADNTLSNVASMTLSLLTPSWELVSVTPTNPSTGLYEGLYTPDELGKWTYRWVGDNPDTAYEGAFMVVGNPSFA